VREQKTSVIIYGSSLVFSMVACQSASLVLLEVNVLGGFSFGFFVVVFFFLFVFFFNIISHKCFLAFHMNRHLTRN